MQTASRALLRSNRVRVDASCPSPVNATEYAATLEEDDAASTFHLRTVLTVAATSTAGCEKAPLSILDPAGPGARPVTDVWWAMLWGSTAILLLVTALSIYVALRRTPPCSARTARALLVGGGFGFPLATLLVLLGYGLGSGHALLPLATTERVYRIDVIGHQWWWEIVYPDDDAGALHSANEIVLPVNRPVDVHVHSDDVIHSFWVPRLGGKIDAIPGRTNVIRLRADAAGIYQGQCAEYCGAQHARMKLVVEAVEEADLRQRLRDLAAPVRIAANDGAAAGDAAEIFAAHCARCHSLDPHQRGTGVGPNLAGFTGRRTIGAGTLVNTPQALRSWLARHQEIKPGNRMPAHDALDPADLEALARLLTGPR